MPYIPADNVCQTELFYIWDGQSCETVLHFLPTVGLTPTLMDELGLFLRTWFNGTPKTLMASTLSLVQIKMTDMTTETAPVVNYSTGLPVAGTRVSASLPNNVALVLTKRTLLRGRNNRGRIYVPGLCEDQVTANQVVGATATDLPGTWDDLINFNTASATWDMVVVSRFLNNNPRVTAEVNQVTNLTTDLRIDSQRRRLPGRGS